MASRHRLHPPSEWSELGERIRNARQKAGLTQVEVASKLGLPQPSIANIERGERQITALELRDLCRILSVSCSAMFDEDIER